MSRLALAFGLLLLVVETTGAVTLFTTSDHDVGSPAEIALALTAGIVFVVSGLAALWRRPENLTGLYLASVGYLWFLGALSAGNDPWVHASGYLLGDVAFIPLAALLLAYPTGRFATRFEAAFPWIVGGTLLSIMSAALLVDRTPDMSCDDCPANPFLVVDSPQAADVVHDVHIVAGVLLALVGVGLLARRWRRAGRALRRVLWPVLATGGLFLTLLVADGVLSVVASTNATSALDIASLATLAAVPVAFLFGVLRTRLAKSAVADAVMHLHEGAPARETLARVLGDPSLQIVYRLPHGAGWIDAEGNPAAEPEPAVGRSITMIERQGVPIAVVEHDAALDEERELVQAVTAAAGFSIHNEQLQAELRSEVRLTHALTQTAPSLLVKVATDGRIEQVNQATLLASGFTDAAALRGESFWNVFIDEEEREAMKERFHAAAPEFPPAEYENTFTNALGERLVIYWRSEPVHDEQGRVVGIVAGGLDVTERHRLAEEKEREREFLNAIANLAPSLMCLIGDNGRVVDLATNISFERALGYSNDETGGHVFWERYVDPDDSAEVRGLIEQVLAGAEIGEHDHHWVTRGGERRLVAWTCKALPRLDERRMFLVSGVDVTERQRREEEIRAGEERFRAVIESAPVAIVEVDLEDRVKLWNPAAERMFGWSPDEVLGGPLPTVPDERREEFRSLSAREASGAAYTAFETIRRHRDGRLIDVEISAAPIRDAAGAVVGAMAVLSDISDRKRQEEELRASRTRLVAAGDEARKRLERNLHDGAQQRLVALSVSLRLAEAKLQDDPAAAARVLAGARGELGHALEELRELARGIHPAILTDRGLAPAVEALLSRFPLVVDVDIPPARLPAAVEAASYYVVAEALTNVAKYAHAAAATVKVLRLDEQVVVEVADDGIGGADPARGSGLRGLADRVAALDGTLAVESTPGRGTRVRAEIPVASEKPVEQPPPETVQT